MRHLTELEKLKIAFKHLIAELGGEITENNYDGELNEVVDNAADYQALILRLNKSHNETS